MARQFNLDTKAAKEANSGGKRITETGKYTGVIAVAFYEQNDRGTESLNIMFKADNGQEAGPLPIYTHNGNGEPLAGYKLANAIMTCCRVKALTPVLAPVELYDFTQGAVVTKQKEIYRELTGKPIGLVLQAEEYEKRDGTIGERMVIAAPFEAGTELMAAEILEKKETPEQLAKFMEYIFRNPVRKLKSRSINAAPSTPVDDIESMDIPF